MKCVLSSGHKNCSVQMCVCMLLVECARVCLIETEKSKREIETPKDNDRPRETKIHIGT